MVPATSPKAIDGLSVCLNGFSCFIMNYTVPITPQTNGPIYWSRGMVSIKVMTPFITYHALTQPPPAAVMEYRANISFS